MTKAAKALKESGATRVMGVASHGVLAGPALERLENSPLEELVITNSIALNNKKLSKIKVLTVAPLLAEAIKRIHEERTVSALFV
jgi:ribose-phosphate pyrophosphokinase